MKKTLFIPGEESGVLETHEGLAQAIVPRTNGPGDQT
jgi:hypothetical protein